MAGGTEPIARRGVNRLTDRAIRGHLARVAAGTATTKKLSDGLGLFLLVTPAGSAMWRWKYRHGEKEKLLALGRYPEVTLDSARKQRDAARALLREGKDPSHHRQMARTAVLAAGDNSLEAVSRSWLELRRGEWSGIHFRKSLRAFERDVFPVIGRFPIGEVTAPLIVAAVRPVAARGARETAGRILQHLGGVFEFAEGLGLAERDPTPAAAQVLPRPKPGGRRPALLDLDALRDVLRRLDLARISPVVRLAHRLAAFTALRIGNVVEAEWAQFTLDGDDPRMVVPRQRMKVKKKRPWDHQVLLGPTIAGELLRWRDLTGGDGYVFPSPVSGKHITKEALANVMAGTLGMKDKHSVHGWRSSLSTLAREHGFASEVVELALDHVHASEVVRAYDRGERLEERRRLMNWWDAQLTGETALNR